MFKRSKYTAEDKYQIIKAYEDGVGSTSAVFVIMPNESLSEPLIRALRFYTREYELKD